MASIWDDDSDSCSSLSSDDDLKTSTIGLQSTAPIEKQLEEVQILAEKQDITRQEITRVSNLAMSQGQNLVKGLRKENLRLISQNEIANAKSNNISPRKVASNAVMAQRRLVSRATAQVKAKAEHVNALKMEVSALSAHLCSPEVLLGSAMRRLRMAQNRLNKTDTKIQDCIVAYKVYKSEENKLIEKQNKIEKDVAQLQERLSKKETITNKLLTLVNMADYSEEAARMELVQFEQAVSLERKQRHDELADKRVAVGERIELRQRSVARQQIQNQLEDQQKILAKYREEYCQVVTQPDDLLVVKDFARMQQIQFGVLQILTGVPTMKEMVRHVMKLESTTQVLYDVCLLRLLTLRSLIKIYEFELADRDSVVDNISTDVVSQDEVEFYTKTRNEKVKKWFSLNQETVALNTLLTRAQLGLEHILNIIQKSIGGQPVVSSKFGLLDLLSQITNYTSQIAVDTLQNENITLENDEAYYSDMRFESLMEAYDCKVKFVESAENMTNHSSNNNSADIDDEELLTREAIKARGQQILAASRNIKKVMADIIVKKLESFVDSCILVGSHLYDPTETLNISNNQLFNFDMKDNYTESSNIYSSKTFNIDKVAIPKNLSNSQGCYKQDYIFTIDNIENATTLSNIDINSSIKTLNKYDSAQCDINSPQSDIHCNKEKLNNIDLEYNSNNKKNHNYVDDKEKHNEVLIKSNFTSDRFNISQDFNSTDILQKIIQYPTEIADRLTKFSTFFIPKISRLQYNFNILDILANISVNGSDSHEIRVKTKTTVQKTDINNDFSVHNVISLESFSQILTNQIHNKSVTDNTFSTTNNYLDYKNLNNKEELSIKSSNSTKKILSNNDFLSLRKTSDGFYKIKDYYNMFAKKSNLRLPNDILIEEKPNLCDWRVSDSGDCQFYDENHKNKIKKKTLFDPSTIKIIKKNNPQKTPTSSNSNIVSSQGVKEVNLGRSLDTMMCDNSTNKINHSIKNEYNSICKPVDEILEEFSVIDAL